MPTLLRSVVCYFAILGTSLAALGAEKNHFILTNTGRPIGTASYTIDKVKNGYRERSEFGVGDTQKDADFTVDENGNFVNGYMQDGQTQAMSTFQVDKSRTSLMVTLAHAYNSQTLALPKPEFMVLPNFDPGAIQLLLYTLLNHPHADSLYYLVIPGQESSDNNAVRINAATDASGTLDGKTVSLKHFHMVYLKGTAELFADADGRLMEADMDVLHTYYVRTHFVISKH